MSEILGMATLVMEKLAPLVTDKLKMVALDAWNMRDEVEKLLNNMTEIRAVILDAEERQKTNTSHELNDWLEKLKTAIDDADDLFDAFSTEDLRRTVKTQNKNSKSVRIFFSTSNQIYYNLRMSPKVKIVRKLFDELIVGKRVFNFQSNTRLHQLAVSERDTRQYISKETVLGREQTKKELMDLLLNTEYDNEVEPNVSVIAIVGMGGLGKTAVAQLVYSDPKIKNNFDFKSWICVGDNVTGFDGKIIAGKIAGRCNSEDSKAEVFRKINKKIRGVKCLIVLDDLWNEQDEPWSSFMSMLEFAGRGTKIVLTTRSASVAKTTKASATIFLKDLNEEESWSLFSLHAFGSIDKQPDNLNLVTIGQEIVKKCAGVPLAIRVIGALMKSLASEQDWIDIKEKDLVKIDEQRHNVIFNLIKISFDHLSFNLKKCFMFCSLFPKDYQISKTMVIRIWIAEGFVQSFDESESLEDVAETYFMTLLDRSFFQDLIRDEEGNIIMFKLHELMHDLATSLLKNPHVKINQLRPGQSIIERGTRHISFNLEKAPSSFWGDPNFLPKAGELRSLVFLPPEHKRPPLIQASEAKLIMSNLKKVRVLSFGNNLWAHKLPSCIGKMIHLRYLDMSNCNMLDDLPKSITSLYNLETLLLNGCSSLRELPIDIWKLTRLRHLECMDCNKLTWMPCGVGKLSSLQTMLPFKMSENSAGAGEIGELNKLTKKFIIIGLKCLRNKPREAKRMNLVAKSRLQELVLNWNMDLNMELHNDTFEIDDAILNGIRLHPNTKRLCMIGFGHVEISYWVNLFSQLNVLKLSSCPKLKSLPLSMLNVKSLTLDNLPSLEWVVNDNINGDSSIISTSLKKIVLGWLPKLIGWCRCNEEAIARGCPHQFGRLEYLCIRKCENLISIPLHTKIKKVNLQVVDQKIIHEVLHQSEVEVLKLVDVVGLQSISGVLQHMGAVIELKLGHCCNLELCNDVDGCDRRWKQIEILPLLMHLDIPRWGLMKCDCGRCHFHMKGRKIDVL